MLYLTAQLVSSRRLGASGVNAFMHKAAGVVPAGADTLFLVDQVSQNPGEVVASAISIPPGGNSVDAFLDVVGSDELAVSDVRAAIPTGQEALERSSSNEMAWTTDARLLFRFYARPDLDRASTYESLGDAILGLFTSPANAPLRIIVSRNDEMASYRVDDASANRLVKLHGPSWRVPNVRFSIDVEADFEFYHGRFSRHLIEVATGLGEPYVRGLGGVVFIDEDGLELGRWP